ncbi:50S ribosomal protein L10 [Thermocrinis minervae]|uniref:Large ribosomal subunit protein uL10 n=1 Tax=Thermocrinis minervae TaxID=381751 RepID=A0A1M6RIZ6_9AQUI|nr:50S ribosomal protein L10 [Thermocrinis minervae]SHK32348.1 LSU ribosomal protein L10P [Thermocrinis minervae]
MRRSWEIKGKLIESYKERINRAKLVIFFDFTKVDAYPLSKLRLDIKDLGGEIVVGKNTLFYRAFMDTVIADHREVLVGPTALVFAYQDPAAVAKKIFEFSKELNKDNPLARIRGGYMEGRFLKPSDVQMIAELPPKEVLVAKLMGALQAPLINFILALKSAPQKLVLTLKAIEDKKSQT